MRTAGLVLALVLLAPLASAMPPTHVLPRFVNVTKGADAFLVFVGHANATSRLNASDWNRDEVYDQLVGSANVSATTEPVPAVALAWTNATLFDSHRASRWDHIDADAHLVLTVAALPPADLAATVTCALPRGEYPDCELVP